MSACFRRRRGEAVNDVVVVWRPGYMIENFGEDVLAIAVYVEGQSERAGRKR